MRMSPIYQEKSSSGRVEIKITKKRNKRETEEEETKTDEQ